MVFLHGSIETMPTFGVFSKKLPPWRDDVYPPLVYKGLSEYLLYRRAARMSQSNSSVDHATVEEHNIIKRLRSFQVGYGDLNGPPCECFHIYPRQSIARSGHLFCHNASARLLNRGKTTLVPGLQQS